MICMNLLLLQIFFKEFGNGKNYMYTVLKFHYRSCDLYILISLQIIPEETVFKWNVTGPTGTSYAAQGNELKYDFPQSGMYYITVVGEYDGGTFSKQRRLQAECEEYCCSISSF